MGTALALPTDDNAQHTLLGPQDHYIEDVYSRVREE